MNKLISIVIPCLNEEKNIKLLYAQLVKIMSALSKYNFEVIFIDNSSIDNSVLELKKLVAKDKRVKVIINNKNFGFQRSPVHGLFQSSGDAAILIGCDMQEPPELIFKLVEAWEQGSMAAQLVKTSSKINFLRHFIKKIYYRIVNKISDIDLLNDATGNGLYDKKVIQNIKNLNDPNPYFRGIVSELGYIIKPIPYEEQRRIHGSSNNNWYVLYGAAMQGFTSYSIMPLRLVGIIGFVMAGFSFLIGLTYATLKIFNWDGYPLGLAPFIIGNFFLFGLLFIFVGIIGEYILSIQTYVKKRPLVTEKDRINF